MEIKFKTEDLKLVHIDKIIPNPRNRNTHPKEQIEHLAKIIKAQGFRSPLIVSKRSGFLVAGHGRLEASKLLGMTELPVIEQDFDSEAMEWAHVVADNEIARQATLDQAMLLKDIQELNIEALDFDLELLGLKDLSILTPMEIELKDEIKEDMNKKWLIEVQFPNEMEMRDIFDDLTSRGYLVKEK